MCTVCYSFSPFLPHALFYRFSHYRASEGFNIQRRQYSLQVRVHALCALWKHSAWLYDIIKHLQILSLWKTPSVENSRSFLWNQSTNKWIWMPRSLQWTLHSCAPLPCVHKSTVSTLELYVCSALHLYPQRSDRWILHGRFNDLRNGRQHQTPYIPVECL